MTKGTKRVNTRIIVILAVAIPIFLVMLAFCGFGAYVALGEDIMPNTSIAGVNVSWLTHDDALMALGAQLQDFESRGRNASVSVVFPDGSALNIMGEDVQFHHNALSVIREALSSGRGNGFFMDTLAFFQRLNGKGESYEISSVFDMEFLRVHVNVFTENYNNVLESSIPVIHDDRIVIVKGAGEVRASEFDVYELALDGLLESFHSGLPVEKVYNLPEAKPNTANLVAIREAIFTQVLCAEYEPETRTISDSVVGVDFDFLGSAELLKKAESGKTITIDVEYIEPDVTKEYLESFLFRDLIGEYTTRIPGTSNRLNNIVLASEAINGIVLESGEEFSFNRIVGRRTYARGYRSAPAFSGGLTVQAIGGGICQVSSTIYSSIKDTDILVTERYPHGRPVAYIPRGRDATVSWGTLDFKFANNTEHPLRVDIEVVDRIITVKVFGTIIDNTTALT